MKMQTPAAAAPDGDATDLAQSATDRQAPNCDGMAGPLDPEFANLCAEHCHHGQQSDQPATMTVSAALPSALYITPLAPEPVVASHPATATSALVAASPPIAILHCCFRL